MKKTMDEVPVKGQRVFVRFDFNVPIQNSEITDDTRIKSALPTLQYLVEQGAKVVAASHLGRPKGQVVPELRLKPVADYLDKMLPANVFMSTCDNPAEAQAEAAKLKQGEILLLENLRFHPGEEANEEKFARSLASMADIYVNDAFGTVHREHASTYGIVKAINGPAVAGFLLAKELKYLGEVVSNPDRPFVVVIGGAKISDKIGVINRLMETADRVMIGGGMANTFLYAKGFNTGKSLVEVEALEEAKALLQKAEKKGVTFYLPEDVITAEKLAEGAETRKVSVEEISQGEMALDIGPETIKKYAKEIKQAATVVMNGPMGVFETRPFDVGTREIAKALAECKGTTIVGGGDSAAAVALAGVSNKISHISTGGGAALKFLEGKALPGVDILQNEEG